MGKVNREAAPGNQIQAFWSNLSLSIIRQIENESEEGNAYRRKHHTHSMRHIFLLIMMIITLIYLLSN